VNLKLGNGDSVGNMGGLGAEGAAWVPGVAMDELILNNYPQPTTQDTIF
jgi:hypothetical protein